MRHSRRTQNTIAKCNRSRRGAVLTIVMICLLICSMILTSILTLQIRSQRQLQREEEAQQADLYAQAGLERALIRFRKDPEYRREEWKPSVGDSVGLVMIEIVPTANIPQEFKIRIVAHFPAEEENSPQRIREVTVQRSL